MLKHVVKNRCTQMKAQDRYLTLSQAAQYLGISRVTLWRRIRDGTLSTYQASTSRREKLVRQVDLDNLRRPRPLTAVRYSARHTRKVQRSHLR